MTVGAVSPAGEVPRSGITRTIAGRYRIEREIAAGGVATVYRVLDDSTGQHVALKRLRELTPGDDGLALFEREYHTLRRLHHPTIVEVYDYGLDDGHPYYTMELLEGHDLRELAPLGYREACRHLRDVASSLALLHARRLVHRDVSARNVVRTTAGRCKLLDFGGLAPFGVSLYIIGTPPFTAPEVLTGVALDHRVDLYALGALAYWLLARRHAFPARDFAELLQLARKRPVRPSDLVPGVPAALDDLVLALLSHNPLARPSSAAEVIDRLTAIADLDPEETLHVAQSYFASPALVGRDAELGELRRALERAVGGQGGMLLVEGSAGMGKTRLLNELAIEGQIASAVVVSVDAAMHRDALGVANALATRLLDVAPAEAFEAARPYAGYLARLSSGVRHRLDATMRAPHGEEPGEWRGRIQEALQQWLLAVSRRRPVVLAVDNAQQADASSLALVTALGIEAKNHPLLIVASAPVAASGSAIPPLRRNALCLKLSPLSSSQTADLVRSLFGDVPNVGRLAERLEHASSGNPLACVEGARRLVTTGAICYAEGTWVLTREALREPLASDLGDVARERIGELTPAARAMAEALSLVRGPIRMALCTLLAREAGLTTAFDALDELVMTGILLGHGGDYQFAQESLRQALQEDLPADRRKALHRRIGEWMLARPEEQASVIEAGWHLLHAGEESRGAELLARQAVRLRTLNVFEGDVQGTTEAIEVALAVYRKQKRSAYELIPLLFALTVCGWFFDRSLATRYGDETLAMLEHASGLRLARRLRPFWGGKLSVILGLLVGRIRFALRPRRDLGYDFDLLIVFLVGSVTTMCAVGALCVDTAAAARAARVLEPFAALGRRRTTPYLHRYCELLTATTQERFSRTRRGWLELESVWEDPKELTLLSDEARKALQGGIWNALAILECMRGGPSALEYAKRLDALGVKLYEMVAAQVRAMYHLLHGEVKLADAFCEKVELHAIQLGSAWQVEVWWPVTELNVHEAIPADVLRMKQLVERMDRLAQEIPSLVRHAMLARATYLRARGDFDAALRLAEQAFTGTTPRSFLGWAIARGGLAAIHNARGDYQRALEVADEALSHYRGDDRQFILHLLSAEVEAATALAGLGQFGAACERLERLLEDNATSDNPLVLGALHYARARVALFQSDGRAFMDHLGKMRRWFSRTENPALVAYGEALADQARKRAQDTLPPVSGPGAAAEVTVRRR